MKRAVFLVILFLVVSIIISPCYAAMDTHGITIQKTPFNKLLRGTLNVLTCIVELPASIWDTTRNKGLFEGCTKGVIDGVVTSVARLGTGVFDIVSFAFPPYDKPILTPEYAIDSAKDKMGIIDESL
jgi:putative exosortase-associated protein (TIGR04073 family)